MRRRRQSHRLRRLPLGPDRPPASGPIFSGRTRVRGMHVHASTNAVALSLRNTSITGAIKLTLGIPGGATNQTDPYIPDDGILFTNGAYTDVTGLGSATFFFDG